MKSRNYNILPNRNRRISYIQYKEAKRLPVFKMNKYRGGFHEQIYNQRKSRSVLWQPKPWAVSMPIQPWEPVTALNWYSTPC